MKKIIVSSLLAWFIPFLSYSQFVKVTDSPIVDQDVASTGAAWGDYNNDGYEDLFINVTATTGSSINLSYENNGDESFTSITAAGLSEEGQGRGATWGDYDNDGNLDLFVANAGSNYLYKNNGDGTFLKIENEPIVDKEPFVDTNSCAWGDYNHDGYLDMYVANYDAQDLLFLNNQGLASRSNSVSAVGFVLDEINLAGNSKSTSGSWVDFDNNGTLDLMIANYYEPNELYSNNGFGVLSYATNTGLQVTENESVGGSWADYDNDGDLDLFLNNNVNRADEFYDNNSDKTFTEVQNLITTSDIRTASSSWGDFDNDGLIDLAIVTDQENFIFRNTSDGFVDVTADFGFSDNSYSTSVTIADYNNDGFVDIFVANQEVKDFLYKNQPNSNHWIQLKLVGTNTNRAAIGANVRIKTAEGWQMRTTQSQTAHNAQNSMISSFGLASNTKIDTIRVEWPLKGFQELYRIDADQRLTIEEMEFPNVPSDLSADIIGSVDVELTWSDNSDNESGFFIERAVEGVSPYTIIASVEANITSYVDSGVSGRMSYRVSAKTTSGYSWYSNIESVDVITDIDEQQPFRFYPNPAQNHLVLENLPRNERSIKIIDATGKNVRTIDAQGLRSVISISDLEEGLYFILVSGRWRHKFYKMG